MGISFIGGIFSKIVEMSITAGIVILAVLLIRLLLKRAPKVFSYALWGIVLFRLLCPVSFSSRIALPDVAELSMAKMGVAEYLSQGTGMISKSEKSALGAPLADIQKENFPSEEQGETMLTDAAGNARTDTGSENTVQGNVAQNRAVPDATLNDVGKFGAGWTVLAVVWIGGILLLLAVNLVSYIRIRMRVSSALPLRGHIYLSDEVDTPFCLGMMKPRIYLPSSLEESERGYVILHEQHHIKRGDHIIKVAAFFALCLHWFNPLVWLAFVLAGKDMEMSCDEAVMRKMDGDIRAEYSASLLHLATGKRIFAASPLAFGEGDPKQRIKNIMDYERPGIWLILGGVIACAAAFIVLMADPEHIDLLERADDSELDQIIVYDPDGTQKLYSDPEHMDAVVDFMQSMKCHRSSADNKDGYGMDIEFVYSDGRQKRFVFHGDQKLSMAEYITRMVETEIYNEADGKYGVVIDGAYVTVADRPPMEKRVEAVDVGWYKCSRDYSGELRELLESFPPEKVIVETAHTYIPSATGVDTNDAVDYLPVERITEETKDAHNSVTEHHYEMVRETGGSADSDGSLDGQNETLTYSIEGMTETVPAKRVSGAGYSLLIPKDGWMMSAPDLWCEKADPRISIWVAKFMGIQSEGDFTEEVIADHLSKQGYRLHPIEKKYLKEDEDTVMVAEIKEVQSTGGWIVSYRYPKGTEAEEGWRRRLETIAGSFTAEETKAAAAFPGYNMAHMGDLSFALSESKRNITAKLNGAGVKFVEYAYTEEFDKDKYDSFFDIDGYLVIFFKNNKSVRFWFVDSDRHEGLTQAPQTSLGVQKGHFLDDLIDQYGNPMEEKPCKGKESYTVYRYYYGEAVHEFLIKAGVPAKIDSVDIYNAELCPVHDENGNYQSVSQLLRQGKGNPTKEQVLSAREKALKGMSQKEIRQLTEKIRDANAWMENAYFYNDLFGELSDQENVYWNYFDSDEEIQIEWTCNDSEEMFIVCEKEGLTPEAYYKKYGIPFMSKNPHYADNFIAFLEKTQKSVMDESLRKDLQMMIDDVKAAADTHDVKHLENLFKRLHDMDYYLLRYGVEDVGVYVKDQSFIRKYYGVLQTLPVL